MIENSKLGVLWRREGEYVQWQLRHLLISLLDGVEFLGEKVPGKVKPSWQRGLEQGG